MSYNNFTGYNVFEEANTPFQLSPNTVNSASVSLNPDVAFLSAFVLSPDVVNSISISIDPIITYTGIFSLNPFVVNSLSVALAPILSFGNTQRIGTVTASFSGDLYTARFAD